jgi:hypothetical protein
MKTHLYSSFVLAALVALFLAIAARADTESSTLKFSDPTKPGTLRISVSHGDLKITGADTPEITVRSEAKPVTSTPRKDGLRVLTASSSYTLSEKDNVAVLEYGTEGGPGIPAQFAITMPRTTSLVVSCTYGCELQAADLSGDVEVKAMNGEIKLCGLSGSALVETMNGEIDAGFARLPPNKTLSFASMNGEVVLRIPADTKANVKLRTQNGAVLTDFDDQALVTKTELVRSNKTRSPRSGGVPPVPAAPVAPTAPVSPVAPVAPAAPSSASTSSDAESDSNDVHRAMHDAAVAVHDAVRAVADDIRASVRHEGSSPRTTLPPMTGGKVVSGALNGGGPEINVTTMNGDVTLRKAK